MNYLVHIEYEVIFLTRCAIKKKSHRCPGFLHNLVHHLTFEMLLMRLNMGSIFYNVTEERTFAVMFIE